MSSENKSGHPLAMERSLTQFEPPPLCTKEQVVATIIELDGSEVIDFLCRAGPKPPICPLWHIHTVATCEAPVVKGAET